MEVKRIEPRRTKEDAKWERSCRPVLPLSSLSPFFASFRDGGLGYGRRLRRALGLSVVSLRTKQSQLADTDRDGRRPVTASAGPSLGPIAPNKPNLPRSGRKRRCPAGPEALPTVGAIAPNKANFARAGTRERGQTRSPTPLPLSQERAKQSQIPPEQYEGQVLFGKGVMTHLTRKRPRPNKANSRTDNSGHGPARLPAPPVGPTVRNKANLPRTDRKRQWLVGPQVLPPLGISVRNKANFRGRANAMDLEQTIASPFDFAQSLP